MNDRRDHRRYEVCYPTEIKILGRDPIPSLVQDISRSGASLLSLEPLRNGQTVILKVILDDGGTEVVPGRVIREKELGARAFWKQQLAVKFYELIPQSYESLFLISQQEAA